MQKVTLPLQTADEESSPDIELWQSRIKPLSGLIKPTATFRHELRRRLLDGRLRLVEMEPNEPPVAA